jgi:hypothetical protein
VRAAASKLLFRQAIKGLATDCKPSSAGDFLPVSPILCGALVARAAALGFNDIEQKRRTAGNTGRALKLQQENERTFRQAVLPPAVA